MVILATIHEVTSTGVVSVGEFVELGVEPRRSTGFSIRSILSPSAKTQGSRNKSVEVGVSHSSDEAG